MKWLLFYFSKVILTNNSWFNSFYVTINVISILVMIWYTSVWYDEWK